MPTPLPAPLPAATLQLPEQRIPVTILTGFLGSGKTTVLNHILQNCQNLKVAVLVNEFGDINIDSQLLVAADSDLVELSNGCICCTINESLVDAVLQVLNRPEKVDYLIVETTGVADPLPIAWTFVSTDLRDLTYLDSILTLVDVETFTPEHFDSQAALSQIALGDILLLNKTDRVSPAQVQQTEAYLRETKPGARILRSRYGQVPLPLILGVGLSQPLGYPAPNQHHHPHDHEHDHHDQDHHSHENHASDHLENDGFVSVSFVSDRPFKLEKFQTFLTEQMPENIFRAKGLLWFQESGLRYIFQLSGKRYEMSHDQWPAAPQTQLVFIGRDLDSDQIRSQLAACTA